MPDTLSKADLPTASEARQPRGTVKLNDEIIPGWISLEVDNNAYRSADTFRVLFCVSLLAETRNADWFSRQKEIKVEIFTGFPTDPQHFTPEDLDSLIIGHADEINFDPGEGTIELCGRDLTALLIDTKTSEHFANQTASQIATTLAKRRGLTPVVTVTHTKAGLYYQHEHASLMQQQSEWELLSFLANVEDFQLYVKGQELHFEPRSKTPANSYLIVWKPADAQRGHPVSNVVALNLTRNLTIARDVIVKVHSWNSQRKQGFTESFPKAGKAITPGQAASKTREYEYTIAGLTPAEAQQRAQSIYRQIIVHEMRLEISLPADNMLTCNKPIQVRGTDTKFDQIYYPESITRSLSEEEGYRMEIHAKNKASELEEI
jgi:phage protein D